jgi:pimeloyl-ACP methyl ester carboxylesterase
LLFTGCFIVNAQSSLKDEMRLPWATAHGDFIRDWLIIGGFPNQDGNGFDFDFLQEHQGELKIEPVQGMAHKLQDGSLLEWKQYHSPYNHVNFFDALDGTDFTMKVAYAYTKIQRHSDGKGVLSFGHNVANKIWMNGELIYQNKAGGQAKENNQIEVEMIKGENPILVKSIHGGWTWGFRLRIIEPENFSLIHDFQLSPTIINSGVNDKLIIKTDRTLNPEIQKFDVQVNAVVAGGRIISQKTVKRGDHVIFDTNNWPEGVYDICLKSHNNRGEIVTAYLYWYKGNVLKEAKELLSNVPENPESPEEFIHVMLSELIQDRYGSGMDTIDSSKLGMLYSPLLEYQELKLNKAGKKGNIRPNGFVRLASRDEVDGSPQFCRAYLPREYDPRKKWPLVVHLHGYHPENPVYVKWWSIDARHNNIVDRYPVIYIEPHGRGNTSYQGIGERDVLNCIQMAKQLFNVDEDRIYLKGESMGGGGTWYVGTRHPELFAAIAPVYGGWDYHIEREEDQLANMTERECFNYEKYSSFIQADALLATPVYVLHGDIDKSVDVNNSRYAVRMLQRWGYDIRYHEFPGFGHEGINYIDDLMPWFLSHRRNSTPDRVRVRSAYLRSASAHWLKVTQRRDPYSFIEAEAEVLINNTVRLSTKNVLGIELSPSNSLIDYQKAVKVIWNVNDIRETRVTNGKICLQEKSYKPLSLNKNPEIEGPISEVINTPFAVVFGTISKDSLMVKLCRQKAQDFINYWKEWQKFEPRVFIDTELTEEVMKKYSLILYGGPQANLITQKLSDKIPLKITSQEIEIAGKIFKAKDARVQMVYPHPLNANRYVSVIGATSYAGMYFFNWGNDDFDFYIQDGCVPNNRLGRPMDKLYIAKGVFDYNWQIADEFLETGDPEIRNACPVRKVLSNLTTTIDNIPVIDPKVYQAIAGTYEIRPGVNIPIFIEADKLMVKTPDGAIFQLFPTSETEYFIDTVDIQLTFKKNKNGSIAKVIVHQGNRDMEIKKVE